MLFHASIGAQEPARVASVLAEMLQGEARPFPPFPGSFIVVAGDEYGSSLEIYPLGQVLVPGKEQAEAVSLADADRPSETHIAVGTKLDEAALHAIAAREWWISRTCVRGGAFHVVEIWVENRILIEALTPSMQAEYRALAAPQRKLGVELMSLPVPANDRRLPTPTLATR